MLRVHEEGKRTEMSREQRKGQSSAHVLLQKASSQLRGERVPLKTREEDELAQYLSSLTQKTSQQVKSVSYEEYGDISISSGADPMAPVAPMAHRTASPVVGTGSKFLKKKSSPAMEAEATASRKHVVSDAHWNSQQATSGPSSFRKGQTEEASLEAGKKSILPAQTSTALNKAMTLANLITQRSTASGSGRQLGFSKHDSGDDKHATFQHHGVTVNNARSRSDSASDPSIGHDRGKFIKKPQIPQHASPEKSVSSASSQNVSVVEKDRSKSLVKHPTRQLHSSSQVYLMSEDESLAEFIQHLSGSDESDQKIVKQKTSKRFAQASKRSLPSKQITKQRTPSPASVKGGHPFHRASHSSFQRWSSQDSDIADSIASEVADNIHGKIMIADSISLDEPVPIKVMDASSLDQSMYSLKKPSKSDHSKKGLKSKVSPFKRASPPATSSKRKLKKEGKHLDKNKRNIFQSFGVHTVEELIGGASEKENSDKSEILTEPLNIRKQKDHSTSQIITEIHSSTTPQRQVSYSSQFEESISEKIGEEHRGSHLNHLRSVSETGMQQGNEETETDDYSEDFASETLSVAKTSEDEDSSHYKYSDEDLQRESVATDAQKTKLVIEKRSVEIQTAAPPGLHYQWNVTQTGVSILGPSHGLHHVDPTPIAATVVSPDALEAMTAYSPATLALIDMMKQQMDLIRQFMRVHDCLYHSLTDSNVPDYHYTTLQDTKEYIKRHRNPKLAVKEALQMVSEEVN